MRPSRLWQTGTAALTGALLFAPVHHMIASDGSGSVGVSVTSIRLVGGMLEITVANVTPLTVTGVLAVSTASPAQTLSIPFRVHGGQKTFVHAAAPAGGIVRVGVIVDDGIPF
jgi:hypothetical protein